MSLNYTEKHQPASGDDISTALQQCDIQPDAWIAGFWAQSDGAMIEDLVQIYATDLIAERQQTYDIATWFPDHVLIGDDSGGRFILLERLAPHRFCLLDSGAPFIADALMFSSLDALIEAVVDEFRA